MGVLLEVEALYAFALRFFSYREGHQLADVDICRLPSRSTRCGFLHIVRPSNLLELQEMI